MGTPLAVSADLSLEVESADGSTTRGSLRGEGSLLELRLDAPGAFAGRADVASVRGAADALAAHGLTVAVVAEDRTLVTLGCTSPGWWQRRITGSRNMRVESFRGVWTSARSRSHVRPALLPGPGLAPPSTPLPLAPTFSRRPQPPVTRTHDPARGGAPRLVRAASNGRWTGQLTAHPLAEVTTIGSAADCDIVIDGVEALHAEIRHDDLDEFVLVHRARSAQSRVNGAAVERQMLRTGSRIEIGKLVLVFQRAEYADHGRPYGGRIGGEFGRQRSQPPQPTVSVGPKGDN